MTTDDHLFSISQPVGLRFTIVGILFVVGLIIGRSFGLAFVLKPTTIVCGVALLGNLLSLVWIRSGKGLTYRTYFAIFLDIFLITLAVHYVGGVEATVSWVYAIALIAIASVHGMRMAIYGAVVSSLMYSMLLYGEYAGILPHVYRERINPILIHGDPSYVYTRLLSDCVLFFIAAIVSGLLSQKVLRSKEQLEKTVAERTGELAKANEHLHEEVTERGRTEEALRASEQKFRSLVELTSDWIWETDNYGIYTYASSNVREILGFEPEEMVGKFSIDIVAPDEVDKVAGFYIEKAGNKESFKGFVNTNIRKDGRGIIVETSGMPILDAEGNLLGYRGVDHDITERKRAEEELRNSEERLQILFDSSPDAHYIMDFQGRFLNTNKAAEKLAGYSKDELVGKSFFDLDLLSPEQITEAARSLAENAEGRPIGPNERILKRGDGTKITLEVSAYPIKIRDESVVLGIARDVTDRKRAEQMLRFTQFSVDRCADAALWMGPDARLIYVNDAVCRSLGYSREELLSMTVHDIDPDFSEEVWADHWKDVKRRGSFTIESHHRTKDGRIFPVEVTVNFMEFEEREYNCAFVHDITERKRAEADLEESMSLLTATLESTADAILVVDLEGNLRRVNRKLLDMWRVPGRISETADNGEEEASLQSLLKDPEGEFLGTKQIYEGPVKERLDTLELKDGRIFERYTKPQKIAGKTVGIVLSFRDITEQKKLEQQLMHAQKMESIGTLAGGIAHDFNNLLGGVLGYASLMKANIKDDHKMFRYVDTIEKSAMRAAELTSQLLAFARGGKYETKSIDLNKVVHETMEIIGRTIDKSIEIRTHLAEDLSTVAADSGQLQQVLMNLCVNAADAMPHGGKLIIETNMETVAQGYIGADIGNNPGPHVTLTITDTGTGMDKKTLQRIFEPFYTTKEEGKGTGLGLSMVYGVVKNHGGHVRVYSEPGEGSTFKIFLPADGKPETREQATSEAPRGGDELVLVVDDEESIRDLAKDILETHGYRVLLAEDGSQAVEIFEKHNGSIGLVILDMVMPKMGGHETFQRLKELNPKVKALLSTGYSQNGKAKEILDSGVMGFVQKPYQHTTLLSKVRTALDTPE